MQIVRGPVRVYLCFYAAGWRSLGSNTGVSYSAPL